MTTSPKRSPNARLRTSVVADLKQIRELLDWARQRWSGVSGTVYDPDSPSGYYRPRELHEYPENQIKAWEQLATIADGISQYALVLANQAREQAAAMRAEAKS